MAHQIDGLAERLELRGDPVDVLLLGRAEAVGERGPKPGSESVTTSVRSSSASNGDHIAAVSGTPWTRPRARDPSRQVAGSSTTDWAHR